MCPRMAVQWPLLSLSLALPPSLSTLLSPIPTYPSPIHYPSFSPFLLFPSLNNNLPSLFFFPFLSLALPPSFSSSFQSPFPLFPSLNITLPSSLLLFPFFSLALPPSLPPHAHHFSPPLPSPLCSLFLSSSSSPSPCLYVPLSLHSCPLNSFLPSLPSVFLSLIFSSSSFIRLCFTLSLFFSLLFYGVGFSKYTLSTLSTFPSSFGVFSSFFSLLRLPSFPLPSLHFFFPFS